MTLEHMTVFGIKIGVFCTSVIGMVCGLILIVYGIYRLAVYPRDAVWFIFMFVGVISLAVGVFAPKLIYDLGLV